MSHTTQLPNDWIAIHNGDFSGTIEFRKSGADPDEPGIEVPFFLMEALVAHAVRAHRIRLLEDLSDEHLLYSLDFQSFIRWVPDA